MARRQAFINLTTKGINKLIEDEPLFLEHNLEHNGDDNHKGLNYERNTRTARFNINDIPCVVASSPIGFGEDMITTIYNSNNIELAKGINRCAGELKSIIQSYDHENTTATKVNLERKTGKYIMGTPEQATNNWRFTYKNNDVNILKDIDEEPNGYHFFGQFHF